MLYIRFLVQVKKFPINLAGINNLFNMIKINFPKAM